MKRIMFLMFTLILLAAVPDIALGRSPEVALSARGRVVDQNGKAVADRSVYAVLAYYKEGGMFGEVSGSLKAHTLTDSRGRFTFSNLPRPSGNYPVWMYCFVAFRPSHSWGWCNGAGHLTSLGRLMPEPKEGYEIPIAKIRTFEGSVADQEGNPIAGAVVEPEAILELSETCDIKGG